MRNLAIIFLLFSLSANAQIVNRFRDSSWFKSGVRFDSTLVFSKGAGLNKVLTSDANGRATWQTFSSAGVTQGALDDSISAVRAIRKVDTIYKNLDSIVFKINGIRYSVLDSTGGGIIALQNDTLYLGSSGVYLPYIPLSGTVSGSPVTGDIEMEFDADRNITSHNSDYSYSSTISYSAGSLGFSAVYPSSNASINLNSVGDGNVLINSSNVGIRGTSDFTPYIDSLDYTQKKYVDTHIADTATVLRSLIPDVSSYATITNLKDSTAFVRGLITSSIPTFSLSKNSTRDSIVTTYNGTRSAVKDSSIVMPTFSFGRNASLDSIYAIYNGTRYSAKDSLPTTSATSTTTFTNKRITARVDSTTSSATPTINTDNVDTYKLTAQAADITSFTTNLSGTPSDDQILHIVIIGTAARAITWGSKFESSTVALPTTTVSTNRLDVYFIWNTATSKWRCGGVW